jgi:hypothetical protein
MIKRLAHLLLHPIIMLAFCGFAYAGDAGDGVDQPAAKAALLKAYSGLFTISGNVLTWADDGTTMVWDDGKIRDADALLENPDIEDMFRYVYPKASAGALVPVQDRPGSYPQRSLLREALRCERRGGGQAHRGRQMAA